MISLDRVSLSLAFAWLSLICGVMSSLNCSFQDGFCDWNQTSNQCSWTSTNNNCPYNVKGCVYLTKNSGQNCSTAGLIAEIGHKQNRGIYFEYFMIDLGEGSLEVKNDAGEIIWSCNKSQVPPSWQSAQIILQNENETKAVTIEGHIPPDSQKYIAVKIVEEAEKTQATTNCTSYPLDGATSVIHTTPDFSTINDLSESTTMTSSPETETKNHLTVSTIRASRTTSQQEVKTNRPKETTLTHARIELNTITENKQTQSTNPCEADVPTGSNGFVSVEPMTGSSDSSVNVHSSTSTSFVVGIVVGIIGFLIFIVSVVIFVVIWFRRAKTSKTNISKELQSNPAFEAE